MVTTGDPRHATGSLDENRLVSAARRHPLGLITFGAFLYSTGPVMVGGSNVSGPVLSFWRLWIGATLMGTLALVHIRRSGRPPGRVGWSWAGRAGVAFGIHQLFFMIAVKRTSVVDVTLMQLLAPVFVGVLAAVVFGERPGVAFRLWSLVSIAGTAVVVLAGASGPEGDPVGVAMAIANVAFFALYFTWSKQGREHIDTVPFLFGAVVTAAVLVSGYVAVTGEPVGSIGRSDLLIAASIAVVPGALGHFVSTWPLPWVAANLPPLIQLSVPFLAGTMAYVFLDEPVELLQIAGGVLTLVGVVGALRSTGGRQLAADQGSRT